MVSGFLAINYIHGYRLLGLNLAHVIYKDYI
jgi:hypothetical protein